MAKAAGVSASALNHDNGIDAAKRLRFFFFFLPFFTASLLHCGMHSNTQLAYVHQKLWQ